LPCIPPMHGEPDPQMLRPYSFLEAEEHAIWTNRPTRSSNLELFVLSPLGREQ